MCKRIYHRNYIHCDFWDSPCGESYSLKKQNAVNDLRDNRLLLCERRAEAQVEVSAPIVTTKREEEPVYVRACVRVKRR